MTGKKFTPVRLDEAMVWLYDHELNCQFDTFWDAGVTVRLGDKVNGYRAEADFDIEDLADAAGWLVTEAYKAYPSLAEE